MNQTSLSPKVQNIKFDQYSLNLKSVSRCKTEMGIVHQKPMINLKQILKDHKSFSNHTQIETARTYIVATDSQKRFLIQKRGSRVVASKPKYSEELEKIKQKFIKVAESWHQKEENYLKEQTLLKQEIARLHVIIQHLTKK
ncbi:unnamed protein product [Paramecium pentaurelia]|uniref:Uncharacterized protein n=1 Tax=Paramecium pentaurelia TaxID=43138 RepID=A0A8S1SHS5_9CILI|nr:unnamed protein product [Paramecium pentaurelia]